MSTAGGLGYWPLAPGTAASFLALLLLWLIPFSARGLFLTLLVLSGVGVWAAERTERVLGRKDPDVIVIDEVAGMTLSVLALPRTLDFFLAAFLLFRFMDIAKPFPIRQSQALRGGLGVMLDDLIAGAYTLALLWGLSALLGRVR